MGSHTDAVTDAVTDDIIATTSTCYLRPLRLTDAESVVREANNPNVARYMKNGFPHPYSLSDAEWFISRQSKAPHNHFAIIKHDGTLVGIIGVEPEKDVWFRTGHLGYWLGEDHWGQGIATDAVTGITEFVFKRNLELLRVEAWTYEGNVGSAKVLKKAGFTHEGTARKRGFKSGKVFDMLTFGILREEVLEVDG